MVKEEPVEKRKNGKPLQKAVDDFKVEKEEKCDLRR